MFEDDQSYYQYRAEVEVERAQQAKAPEAVLVHYQMAEAYLSKVASAKPA